MSRAFETGRTGEAMACAYLKKQGFRVLDTNYKKRDGELDIVAKDGKVTVFAEVKTRSDTAYGEPREYVTYKKQQRLRRCAKEWLFEHGCVGACRFDVVEIILSETGDADIRHWRNAF